MFSQSQLCLELVSPKNSEEFPPILHYSNAFQSKDAGSDGNTVASSFSNRQTIGE